MTGLVLTATIRCPHCGKETEEAMPTDACLHFYECPECRTMLNRNAGEFHKLLNLRAVLGIGVVVLGPFGAPYCEKLTTQLTTVRPLKTGSGLT